MFQTEEESKVSFLRGKAPLVILILILIINIVSLFSRQSGYVTQSGAINSEPSKIDFCKVFSAQLLAKTLHKGLLISEVYNAITKDNYKDMELTGKERVFYIYEKENVCNIIVTDDLGLRGFEVGLSAGQKPFYYKAISFNERLIKAREG